MVGLLVVNAIEAVAIGWRKYKPRAQDKLGTPNIPRYSELDPLTIRVLPRRCPVHLHVAMNNSYVVGDPAYHRFIPHING